MPDWWRWLGSMTALAPSTTALADHHSATLPPGTPNHTTASAAAQVLKEGRAECAEQRPPAIR